MRVLIVLLLLSQTTARRGGSSRGSSREDPVPEDHGFHGDPDRDLQATARLRQPMHSLLPTKTDLPIKKLAKKT